MHHTLCPEEDSYRKEAASQADLNFVRTTFNLYKNKINCELDDDKQISNDHQPFGE